MLHFLRAREDCDKTINDLHLATPVHPALSPLPLQFSPDVRHENPVDATLRSTMRSRRSHAALLRLGIMALVCCLGCAREQQGEGPPSLVFKHPKLLSREEPLRALLAQFQRVHPHVQLQEEVLPSSSDQQHLFYVTNLEAGAADFDVFALDVIWVPEFRRAGWLHDLTAYLGPEGLKDFFPHAVEAATHAGRIYAVPWFLDAGVLYYRRDLLDQYGLAPPRTLAELTGAAQRILAGEAGSA